jgi:hypothetical protein
MENEASRQDAKAQRKSLGHERAKHFCGEDIA